MSRPEDEAVVAEGVPSCVACGSPGEELYSNLEDRLFRAPGAWRMVRCTGTACGLLWLDPAPRGATLAAAYAGYYTHHRSPDRPRTFARLRTWIKEGHYSSRFGYRVRAGRVKRLLAAMVLRRVTREALDNAIMFLDAAHLGRVVDVGCGDGSTLVALRALGWEVEGIEADPGAVAGARARGLTVAMGSLQDAALPDASRDAILMSHVLEHVTDPVGLLVECRRVLRPGGIVVVVTPNAAGLGHQRFGHSWRGLEPPRHLQVFERRSLENAVVRAGLRLRSLSTSAAAAGFIHAQSRRMRGERDALPDDSAARSFALEERRALRNDPWLGEDLILMGERRA